MPRSAHTHIHQEEWTTRPQSQAVGVQIPLCHLWLCDLFASLCRCPHLPRGTRGSTCLVMF